MAGADTVVLVHGLWLHGIAMALMKRRIARAGYRVLNYSYPTVRLDLTANAARLAAFCEHATTGTLHLVGHSMGGLVALQAAQALPRGRVGRIVMLGSPYADCYAGRRVQRLPGGGRILGRCMGEWLLATRPETLAGLDIGVVAGSGRLGLGHFVAPGLPRPNDGVVTVEETRVPGMRDHIVLRVSHTLMIFSSEAAYQACAYLAQGRFDHARAAVVKLA